MELLGKTEPFKKLAFPLHIWYRSSLSSDNSYRFHFYFNNHRIYFHFNVFMPHTSHPDKQSRRDLQSSLPNREDIAALGREGQTGWEKSRAGRALGQTQHRASC